VEDENALKYIFNVTSAVASRESADLALVCFCWVEFEFSFVNVILYFSFFIYFPHK
jgi:hypothetical protein